MELQEQTVRQLVMNHDEVQIIDMVSTLRRRLRQKATLLRRQADVAANLRHAFMETELDRDRLQRMTKELHRLCETHDLLREAEQITERYGGIAGPGEAKIVG